MTLMTFALPEERQAAETLGLRLYVDKHGFATQPAADDFVVVVNNTRWFRGLAALRRALCLR